VMISVMRKLGAVLFVATALVTAVLILLRWATYNVVDVKGEILVRHDKCQLQGMLQNWVAEYRPAGKNLELFLKKYGDDFRVEDRMIQVDHTRLYALFSLRSHSQIIPSQFPSGR
jgi:hypothetical protein